MPAKIYTSPYPPLNLVSQSVYTFLFGDTTFPSAANDPAFIDAETGKFVTRADVKRLTLEFAYGARNQLRKMGGPKLKRGSTILIFSPNSIAYPIALWGGFAAGFKCTLANSAYTASELAYQWKDSRAEALFVHPELLPTVLEMFVHLKVDAEVARKLIVICSFGLRGSPPPGFVTLDDLLGKKSLRREERFDGEAANETTLICYSSGTTGKPKGVESTHRNVTSNLQMTASMMYWVQHRRDVSIGILPFYHIYGTILIMHCSYLLGVPVAVMAKFDPFLFCATIEKYRVTYINVVPPILLALARHPATDKYDVSSLKALYSGAAPLGGPLANEVRAKLKTRGADVVIGQGYGLTETSPVSHLLKPEHTISKAGSIGCLHPTLEARLVNEDDAGKEIDAAEGEPGEIWIRGASVMKGYLNNVVATTNAITKDGWFKTGDVAIRDKEGFYYIVDRRKELIKYKGFQVPPAELESLLLQHPSVADAAVIGIESVAQATELPRAYIVSSKGAKTEEEKAALGKEVAKWVETKVSNHKFLRGGVVVIPAIPKSAAGKILRKELRELAKKELSASRAKL